MKSKFTYLNTINIEYRSHRANVGKLLLIKWRIEYKSFQYDKYRLDVLVNTILNFWDEIEI